MSMFSQVAELLTRREQKKTEDFDSLAKAVADGGKKAPTVTQIAERLESLGRTAADLEAEVVRRQQRQPTPRSWQPSPPSLPSWKVWAGRSWRLTRNSGPSKRNTPTARHQLFGNVQWKQQQVTAAEAMRAKLLASYRGPLQQELDDNRAKQGELNREITKAVRSAESHEHAATFSKAPEPTYVQEVRQGGTFLGVVAESTAWTKMKDQERTPLLSAEDQSAELAAAKSLRESVVQLQRELDVLVAREVAILDEMLVP